MQPDLTHLSGEEPNNVSVDSIIHSDGWRGYHGLVDVGYARHFKVHHGGNGFVWGSSHINGIESFLTYAKLRLAKLKGIPAHTFALNNLLLIFS